MLDGVDGGHAEELLGVRHRNIVDERILVSGPANTRRRAGRAGEHGAARTTVLIEDDWKLAAKQIERRLTETPRKNKLADCRVSLEHLSEAWLDQHGDAQIGAPGMQGGDGGSFQHQISE